MTPLDILRSDRIPRQIRAAIFDFDGTFSTLRCGWEAVMRRLMLEMISGGPAEEADPDLAREVDAYIFNSTGIQTVYQMQWLADRVLKAGRACPGHDEWWYKNEYNLRLKEVIRTRIQSLEDGSTGPEAYLIRGSLALVKALKGKNIAVYLASGTDHADVVREAGILGVRDAFTAICGAPEKKISCSKEAVLRMLIHDNSLPPENLLVVGDGKVEIRLGAEAGAFTLGAATDEIHLEGVNPVKYRRLAEAGADAVTGDFENLNGILQWLHIK